MSGEQRSLPLLLSGSLSSFQVGTSGWTGIPIYIQREERCTNVTIVRNYIHTQAVVEKRGVLPVLFSASRLSYFSGFYQSTSNDDVYGRPPRNLHRNHYWSLLIFCLTKHGVVSLNALIYQSAYLVSDSSTQTKPHLKMLQ